tara:strand:- start:8224 stop:8730 length:507 start_codon:yes stop_codon:yes gene_type:complete
MPNSLKRLMRDYQIIKQTNTIEDNYEIGPIDDDNLYEWQLKLFNFEDDQILSKGMKEFNIDKLILNIKFSDNYPISPPFVYIVNPKLDSGFIFDGAICMELLTQEGWGAATSISTLVMSIRAMLIHTNAKVIESSHSYTYDNAKKGFEYLEKYHKENGWTNHRMFRDS